MWTSGRRSYGAGMATVTVPVETIARICHEANRALQAEQADPTIPVAPPWEELAYESKDSLLAGVAGVRAGNTPAQSHGGWCQFKVARGWTYGPVKDEATKQHPLLVPYDELPVTQKIKDDLFVGIVRALGESPVVALAVTRCAFHQDLLPCTTDDHKGARCGCRYDWKPVER